MSELVGRTLELLAETNGGFASAVKNIFNTRTMAPIKISDLSVGDWIRHDFYEVEMRVITIFGDTGRIAAESNSGYGVTCHLDHFSPIPLRPEILAANGFEYNKKVFADTWCWTNEKDTMIEAGMFKDDAYLRIVQLVKGLQQDSRFGVKHVHQLQRALRLAGVEKEIKL